MVEERSWGCNHKHKIFRISISDFCNNKFRLFIPCHRIGLINSSLFMKFMVELTSFLKRHHIDESEKVLILLDNAPSHRSKTIKDYFKASEESVIFLPPYSPELAPMEKYFSILKNLVSKDKCQNTMNWKQRKE